MAWVSGVYSRLYRWTTDRDAGINITASKMDGEDDEIVTGLNNCLTKDGLNRATADIPPATTRLYSVGTSALRWLDVFIGRYIKIKSSTASFDTILTAADATVADKTITLPNATGTIALIESANTFSGNNTFSGSNTFGTINSATAAGTDTYTATLSPAPAAYITGADYNITFTNANGSTTPTLNLSALGAVTIVKEGGIALVAGDIPAGHNAILRKTATQFVLLNPVNSVVKLSRMIRTDVSGPNGALNLGSVNAGDRILITATMSFSTTAGGGNVYLLCQKGTGTATINFGNTNLYIRSIYSPSGADSTDLSLCGIAKVTVGGTLALDLSDGASGTTGIVFGAVGYNAIVLNNG